MIFRRARAAFGGAMAKAARKARFCEGGMRTSWYGIGIAVASVPAGLLAEAVGLPAAWMIAPMVVALLVSLFRPVHDIIPPIAHVAAQAVIGVALSASFQPASLVALADEWLVVLATVGLVLVLSAVTGVLLARVSGLDAATASLGLIPGGASGMVAMSESVKADARVVAFMQYARLILVSLSASLLTRFVLTPAHVQTAVAPTPSELAAAGSPLFSVWWTAYALSAIIAVAGAWAGVRMRLPAGALVGPVILGILLAAFAIPHGAWPPGVLQAAYALIGLWVGIHFDPEAMRLIGRLAPVLIGFTILLMAGCALLGWGLALATGMDPLSAYLATTPGGIDVVTITAIDLGADTSLILPVQMMRLLVMVIAGPVLVRAIVRATSRARKE